jgi:hypothetical protein
LAVIEAAADLSEIVKIVKNGAFVASAPGFTGSDYGDQLGP